MGRDIQVCHYTITPVTVDAEFANDPAAWLAHKAVECGLTWLLAHAYNGVIWGKREGERLTLSSEAFPDVSPPLLATTLQQVKLFGKDAELMLWRDGENKWQGRLLDDREQPTAAGALRKRKCYGETGRKARNMALHWSLKGGRGYGTQCHSQ